VSSQYFQKEYYQTPLIPYALAYTETLWGLGVCGLIPDKIYIRFFVVRRNSVICRAAASPKNIMGKID